MKTKCTAAWSISRTRREIRELAGRGKRLETKLNITGMHCESCAIDIKETLEETTGVRVADVNFNSRQATVEFDENVVLMATIIKKIRDLDYDATVTEAERE